MTRRGIFVTTISSTAIARSQNHVRPDKVLSSLLLHYPLWIHAEQRTHRLIRIEEDLALEEATPSVMADEHLSRNAASMRAIPVKKMVEDIRRDPAVPLFWGAHQRGMQAFVETDEKVGIRVPVAVVRDSGPEIVWETKLVTREEAWLESMEQAIERALAYDAAGYHKQVPNRLLMPYAHIRVVASATEWSNFLAVRDHADAEPHMRMLAQDIRRCLDREDDIDRLLVGQWHLPFVPHWERADIVKAMTGKSWDEPWGKEDWLALVKVSVARCGSTSYKTVDGFDMTPERATALHDKLVASDPMHASPAEHPAQVDEWTGDSDGGPYDDSRIGEWVNPHQHGNFVGFRQYRHMLPGECR
jgi:hypothetical protein